MLNDQRYREERDNREQKRISEAEAREEKRLREAEAREVQRQKEFLLLLSVVMGNKNIATNIFENA
jgi:hypothetical protein